MSNPKRLKKKYPEFVAFGKKGAAARYEDPSSPHYMTPEERKAQAIHAAKAPRKPNAPRCRCGKYTAHMAQVRCHHC